MHSMYAKKEHKLTLSILSLAQKYLKYFTTPGLRNQDIIKPIAKNEESG